MKVIRKSQMPDGTDIQLEDWTDEYEFSTLTMTAYPICKATVGNWIMKGERFRLDMGSGKWNNNKEVLLAFKRLEEGNARLEEFAEHYWNGDKDKARMGMECD